MTAPSARADLFRAVMTRASWRCQCTGQCGQPHAKTGRRCPREHDSYVGTAGGWVRLVAAPADPAAPERQAAAVPVARLWAWCPACLRAARKAAAVNAARPDGVQGGLFDL